MFPWMHKRREKKNNSGCFREAEISATEFQDCFSCKASEQHEKTEVSWTKGKLMNNAGSEISAWFYIYTLHPELKKFKPSKNLPCF